MAHLIPKIEYGSALTTTIEFRYPPAKDDGERYDTKDRVTTALSGKRWTIVDEIEALRSVTLSFLTETEISALRAFFINHAGRGKPFKWFDDKESSEFKWYELNKNELKPRKITSVGASKFIYEVTLELRRIVDGSEVDRMAAVILNNQVSPVTVLGLQFDKRTIFSAVVFYEARRKTSTEERVATGTLQAVYRESANSWSIDNNGEFDSLGVTFSIGATGQVTYTSDLMTGSDYSGVMTYKIVNIGTTDVYSSLPTSTPAITVDYLAPKVTGTRDNPILISAGGITPSGTALKEYIFLQSAGGSVDVTASPQIAAGASVGQALVLISRSDTDSLLLEDGDGLSLNGGWSGGLDSVLELIWDGSNWVEIARR